MNQECEWNTSWNFENRYFNFVSITSLLFIEVLVMCLGLLSRGMEGLKFGGKRGLDHDKALTVASCCPTIVCIGSRFSKGFLMVWLTVITIWWETDGVGTFWKVWLACLQQLKPYCEVWVAGGANSPSEFLKIKKKIKDKQLSKDVKAL